MSPLGLISHIFPKNVSSFGIVGAPQLGRRKIDETFLWTCLGFWRSKLSVLHHCCKQHFTLPRPSRQGPGHNQCGRFPTSAKIGLTRSASFTMRFPLFLKVIIPIVNTFNAFQLNRFNDQIVFLRYPACARQSWLARKSSRRWWKKMTWKHGVVAAGGILSVIAVVYYPFGVGYL